MMRELETMLWEELWKNWGCFFWRRIRGTMVSSLQIFKEPSCGRRRKPIFNNSKGWEGDCR